MFKLKISELLRAESFTLSFTEGEGLIPYNLLINSKKWTLKVAGSPIINPC